MMAWIGPGAELEEEGGKEISSMLLLGVPEVEEEVGHQCQSRLAHLLNFSDDRGPIRAL